MLYKIAAIVAVFAAPSSAFYVPGVKPQTFMKDAEVELKVNALTSIRTQVPRDYYKLPFCQPAEGPKMASENLGEFLTGNKIQSSPYVINMLRESYCQILCQKTLGKNEGALLNKHIHHSYHHNWIIDNLPGAALAWTEEGKRQKHYAGGFPIGYIDDENQKKVYNHVNINIDYHQVVEGEDGYRVVAFAVEPYSTKHKFSNDYVWDGVNSEGYRKPLESCSTNRLFTNDDVVEAQGIALGENIIYSYGVTWSESDVEWASRWDVYLSEDHMVSARVHWYSIINSILVVLFLSGLVANVLVRNLRKDIATYNRTDNIDELEKDETVDETGWKLIHADVFRPPTTLPMIYCVFVGTGVQLCVAGFWAIAFSAVGFLSPARRGSLMTAVLFLYVFCGIFAGYVSSRLHKAMNGQDWKKNVFLTATLFPGSLFALFLLFNIFLAFSGSSGAVPFLDVFLVMLLWCGISVPLVFLGSYFGYRSKPIEFPTVTSKTPRPIPVQKLLGKPVIGMTCAGMVPFAAAYVELFFIMTSLWMDQYYYVFGFTLLVYFILLITCAEMAILLCYYQLCAEDYRWWWYSFFVSGSTSIWLFLYSILWFQHLEPSKLIMTYLLYYGYMFFISFGVFLMCGSIGTLTCFWFVRKIFSSIKVD